MRKLLLFFMVVFASSIYAQNLNTLVLHYTFDDASLDDAIANNDIENNTGVLTCEDRFGNSDYAREFNNNYLLTPSALVLPSITDQVSISVWIKPNVSELNSPISCIFNPGYWGLYLNKFSSNGTLLGMLDGSSNNNSASDESSVIPSNQWIHVVLSNASNNTTLYVNNVLQSSYSEIFSFTNNLYALYIGARGYSTAIPVDFFNGQIDDFRIYSRALTPSDINELFNQPNPATNSVETLISERYEVNIFPNPSSDKIQLVSDFKNEIDDIRITDPSGKDLGSIECSESNYIDVSHLTKGNYFITVIFKDQVKQTYQLVRN